MSTALKLLRLRASSWSGDAASKVSRSQDSFEIILSIAEGGCFRIEGDFRMDFSLLMYAGSSFGFRKGWNFPLDKLKVTSCKSVDGFEM